MGELLSEKSHVWGNSSEESYTWKNTTDAGLSSGFKDLPDDIIPPYDQSLVFQITNTNPVVPFTAILFDSFENAPQPAPLTFTVLTGVSEQFVRNALKDNPISINGFKYAVLAQPPTSNQLANLLTVRYIYETGQECFGKYQPMNYTNPTNFNSNIIDDPTFRLDVDGRTSILLTINGGTTVNLIFNIERRRNVINNVKGKNDLQVAKNLRPSGNSVADTQIQLMRLRSEAWGQKELTL